MSFSRHILVAVDFSRCSRAALAYAVNTSAGSSTDVDVLYVARPVPNDVSLHIPPEDRVMSLNEYARSGAMRDLDHLVASMRARLPMRLRSRVELGDPGQIILRVAEEERCDLIVMGSHSQSARTDVRLGSVAAEVARGASCPVVTVSGTEIHGDAKTRVLRPVHSLPPVTLNKPSDPRRVDLPAVKWIG